MATRLRTHVRPLTFELWDPTEQKRYERVSTPVTGEPLSGYLLRQFAEIDRTWALDAGRLEAYREALTNVVEKIEAGVEELGGQHLAFADARVQFWIAEAERIISNAARAYVEAKGYSLIKANSARARASRKNPEIEVCIERAKSKPGTAKDQWHALLGVLEKQGFVVRETAATGTVAYEIDLSSGMRRITFKTFQNRAKKKKSR